MNFQAENTPSWATVCQGLDWKLCENIMNANMDILHQQNQFVLLANMLSPFAQQNIFESIHKSILQDDICWEGLLHQANINLCTPHWFLCLRNGILQHLPQELQQYLESLYLQNVERNRGLSSALKELLTIFAANDLKPVLLKGAATLCDNLYGDIGSRIMQDLDIYVFPDDAEKAAQCLLSAEYVNFHASGSVNNQASVEKLKGGGIDSWHHHLPAFYKPGTQTVVEIHHKLASLQSEPLFPAHIPEDFTETVIFENIQTRILKPTYRAIQNTAHALMQNRAFLRGEVSLLQILEFSLLVKRYFNENSWRIWFEAGEKGGLKKEFLTYLHLAHRLFGMPYPEGIPQSRLSRLHGARIIAASGRGADRSGAEAVPQRIRGFLLGIFLKGYYVVRLPKSIWRNTFYKTGTKNFAARIHFLLSRLTSE